MGDYDVCVVSGICLHVQILGIVIFLKQGDMLQLHVTTKYLSRREARL